jgi:nitroreductase
LKYYLLAKKYFSNNKLNIDKRLLLIRKRAHHLERALFMPEAYPAALTNTVAVELQEYLAGIDEAASPRIIQWAKRILAEFTNNPACPLLAKNIKRNLPLINSNDLLGLIKQRRSRRLFARVPLTENEKMLIVEAAQYAPSSCNRQTLHLIFVEDAELKKFLATTVSGAHHFFEYSPCIIVVVSDAGDYKYPEDRMIPFIDAAAAIQNINLLCETMGLGCCWASYSSYGSIKNESKVRNRLHIPATHLIVGAVAVGKSDQFICEIPRDLPQKRYGNDVFMNNCAREKNDQQ